MPPRISLALALHNHQPVGNFGWVFAEVFEQAYAPMVEALERHPDVRLSLHYTGPLLDWLIAERAGLHRPSPRPGRARPGRDPRRRATTSRCSPRCRSATGSASSAGWRTSRRATSSGERPRGAWLAERVWEPDLPTSLVAAGYGWTILDDAHFRAAAIPEDELWGPYTTEDQGQRLRVFGTEQGLRYRIPFRDVDDVIDYLRDACDRRGRPARDDGRRRREVRRLAHDLGALLGRGPLGRAVLRGARGERRLADRPRRRRAGWPTTRPSGGSTSRPAPTRDGRVGAAARREPRLRRPSCTGARRSAARGTLAAWRVLAQLPGQVPRDQRPPQADAPASPTRGGDAGRRRPRRRRSTTSTRASRTTATGTACSAASTSATCALATLAHLIAAEDLAEAATAALGSAPSCATSTWTASTRSGSPTAARSCVDLDEGGGHRFVGHPRGPARADRGDAAASRRRTTRRSVRRGERRTAARYRPASASDGSGTRSTTSCGSRSRA